MHEFYLSTGNTWDNPEAVCLWSGEDCINSLVGFRWESPYIFQNYIIDDAYGLFFVYDQNYDDIDIEWHFEMSESPEPFVEGNGNNSLSTRSITSTSSAVEWIEDDLGVGWWGQDTKLTYALQEVVNSYSPIHFVLLGIPIEDGLKRCYFRSNNFSSYCGAQLHVKYTITDFTWESPYPKWYQNAVSFDDTALPSSWREQISLAASTWNSAPANFYFCFDAESENKWNRQYLGPISELAIASIYYPFPGDPLDKIFLCQTTFNTYYDFYIGSDNDIQTVALHEFGHWLSLGDNPSAWPWDSEKRDRVMYCDYTGIKRVLQPGDEHGIVTIYGY